MINSENVTLFVEFSARIQEDKLNELYNIIDNAIDNDINRFVLVISSNGGDAIQGLKAYNYLKFRHDIHLITYNLSNVESAATNLFLAGNIRFCHPNSIFSIHQSKWKEPNYLTEDEINQTLQKAKHTNEMYINIITEETNLNREQVQEAYFKGTIYNAIDCVKHNIANKICENILDLTVGEFLVKRIL